MTIIYNILKFKNISNKDISVLNKQSYKIVKFEKSIKKYSTMISIRNLYNTANIVTYKNFNCYTNIKDFKIYILENYPKLVPEFLKNKNITYENCRLIFMGSVLQNNEKLFKYANDFMQSCCLHIIFREYTWLN